ncbi:MAG: ABC transporter ATP-binding protein [Nakamurella sp.]
MFSAEDSGELAVLVHSPSVITTSGLTKVYRGRTVVDSLDIEVPAGVVCGFVGPNGAGKTTTIRMLLGLVRPTSGSGTVLGEPLQAPERFLRRVGAMIEGPAFTPALSGADNLRVLARAGGLPPDRVDVVLDRVGLASRRSDRYRSYSLGMKQRLGIAAALLPSPNVLVLDEPTNGLDPAGIVEIRDLISQFRADGMTVFVSSHLLSELEQVADHLVVIRSGRLVFQGTVADLIARRPPTIVMRPENRYDTDRLAGLAKEMGLVPVLQDDGEVLVSLSPSMSRDESYSSAAELNRRAHRADILLARLDMRRPTLEDAFLELTGGRSGDVK